MEDLFRQYGLRILMEVPICFVAIAADRSPIRADSVGTAAIRQRTHMTRSQIRARRDIRTDTRTVTRAVSKMTLGRKDTTADTSPMDLPPAGTAPRRPSWQAPVGLPSIPPEMPGGTDCTPSLAVSPYSHCF